MLKRLLILVAILVILGVGGAIASSTYIYINGGSGEASEVITLNAEQLEAEATEQRVFRIIQEASSVSFTLEEDLRGVRNTVIGTTDQVAGDILVDASNPVDSEIGVIRINLRTLATDSDFRDRAIRSEILNSADDAYEFTEFVPTSTTGMPDSVAVGDTITFQVTGTLPLVDVAHEVTFDVTLTAAAEDRIEGTATATVLRSDYGLEIPSVPSVANVADEVQLTIDFMAVAVDSDATAG